MGSSALDFINKTNPPVKKPGGSALDYVNQPVEKETVNEHPDAIDDLTNKLGNLGSYMKSLTTGPQKYGADVNTLDVLKNLGGNLATTVNDEYNKTKDAVLHPLTDTAPGQKNEIFSDQNRQSAIQPFLHPIETAAGFASSLSDQVEKTVGSLTNTVNEDGVARAATPAEQAQNLQSLAGTVAQIAVFKGVKGALTLPTTAEEAIALQRTSRLGKIARNMAGEGIASAAAGGAQGYVTNIGNPAQQEAAISQALTFLPIGMAFGLLSGRSYINELDAMKEELVNKPNSQHINDLAALNGLRAKSTSTVDDLTKNVDIINKSDNLVEAELKNKLQDNDGFVTNDLTHEEATALVSKVEGSPKTQRPNYQPIPEVADRIATIKAPNGQKLPVEFEHPLDKVAYLASVTKEGKRSKVLQSIIDDARQQTGLTSQELINFGKNVREGIKKETPIPRDQATIDEVNRASQQRGEALISNSKEGDVITNGRNENFIRDGNLIKGPNGVAYPTNSQEGHLIIGRDKSYEQQISPVINLKEQPFNTQYGDELHTGINVYHSPTNGSTLITKLGLNDYGKSFFEKTGYLPGEVISYNGKDHFVTGANLKETIIPVTKKVMQSKGIYIPESPDLSSVGAQATNDHVVRNTYNNPYAPNSKSAIAYDKAFGPLSSINKMATPAKSKYSGWDPKLAPPENITQVETEVTEPVKSYTYDGTIKVKDPTTGKIFDVPSDQVRRNTGTLQSITNSEGFTRIGKLSKETYLDNLWKRYYEAFKNTSESFATFNQQFFKEQGIEPKDFESIENVFYKRLADNTSQDVLTKEEIATRARMATNFDALDESRVQSLKDQLEETAKSNNLILQTEGAGKYTLKTGDGGWSSTVTSPDDVFETIRTVKQLGGLALDGGSTNVINTAVANTSKGGYGQTFKPKERSAYEKWYDNSTSTGILSKIAPVVRRFASVDNSSKVSSFLQPALDIQEAQMKKKSIAQRSDFQDLTGLGKKVMTLGKSLPEGERWKVADYIETANANEIANSSLPRPLNSFEKKFATTILGKVDVNILRDEMYKARVDSKAQIGTPEYALALKNTIKDPARLKAAQQLILSGQKLGPNMFSTTTVMDYADAINNPSKHLSRDEFASKNNFTKDHRVYAQALDEYYKKAAQIAGIPQSSILSRYLPRIRSNILTGDNAGIPEGFARELERFGITGTGVSERDPNELVRIYHSSLLNHISGFSDALGKASTQFDKNVTILKQQAANALDNSIQLKNAKQYGQSKAEEIRANYYDKLAKSMDDVTNTYINDSRGIPDMADQSQKAASKYFNSLGLKSPEQNSVLQLFSLGHIALRPALAFRDIAQSLGNVYISFGHEMAEKAFAGSLSQEYMEAMQKKGVIPKMEAGQLIDPGSSGTGGFGSGAIQKLSESSYRLSGQELAYNRVLAGIYKATMTIGERELDKLHKGVITKEQAYERLGLHNHGPSIQTEFDNLVTSGKPDRALDFLGKWNGRYAANYFGMANAPSGWNTNFGRLLGQYGSWSANATHTLLEQTARGSKKQILGKVLRAGTVIGAAYAAESVTGMKLHNWAAGNPLTTFPGVGPAITQGQDVMSEWQKTGDFSGVLKLMGNDALGMVPYYQAMQDWKKSYQLLSRGDPRGIPQGIGIQASKP